MRRILCARPSAPRWWASGAHVPFIRGPCPTASEICVACVSEHQHGARPPGPEPNPRAVWPPARARLAVCRAVGGPAHAPLHHRSAESTHTRPAPTPCTFTRQTLIKNTLLPTFLALSHTPTGGYFFPGWVCSPPRWHKVPHRCGGARRVVCGAQLAMPDAHQCHTWPCWRHFALPMEILYGGRTPPRGGEGRVCHTPHTAPKFGQPLATGVAVAQPQRLPRQTPRLARPDAPASPCPNLLSKIPYNLGRGAPAPSRAFSPRLLGTPQRGAQHTWRFGAQNLGTA